MSIFQIIFDINTLNASHEAVLYHLTITLFLSPSFHCCANV